MVRGAAALAGGILFGLGLCVSRMVRPEIVLDFLHLRDLGLLLVLGGATGVSLVVFQLAPRALKAPLLGGRFEPHPGRLGAETVVGAAIFGAGWGLCGVCPGPALAGLGAGLWPLGWAVLGLAAGAWLHGLYASRR
ncbi:MAG: YeeE/YedE family protein [Elusimicrobia bacterium]|nr:YeeE/YedE family protein [Elusimicrobiota bacterium]